ncbi:MAG: DUF2232 domain-containing protein [candidate division Zixibacteria bacterium]|nr:DUF2232 domain-containing protein [candidate division Zixibacteria bacterium]
MPDWQRAERYINYFGLFLILAFPVAAAIPVAGYVIETVALSCVILFAFRRKRLLLALGSVGSIAITWLVFGFNPMLIGVWAMVIIPGTLLGGLMAEGMTAVKSFVTAALFMAAISLFIFWSEKETLYQVLDYFQSWTQPETGIKGDNGNDFAVWGAKVIMIIKRLTPSLMALSGITQLFIAAIPVLLILRGAGGFAPTFGDFVFWKMPLNYIYPVGLFIILRMVGGEIIKIVADNFLLFFGIFYTVFGFAVIEYCFRKLRLSLFLRVLFYIGLFFMQLPGLILMAAVGIFDSYFDFRKVRAKIIG